MSGVEIFRDRLRVQRDEWEQRLRRIRADRRRESDPLDRDWDEQVPQRENDETLDALDAAGRRQLEAIDAALGRLEAGSYGRCERCGHPIEEGRLEALPTAATCARCARAQAPREDR